MLSKSNPTTWEDLQEMVANILRECKFSVEIEKKIHSARGAVSIDVYAEEQVFSRPYIVLCECKYWKARIPQSIVHGFRTIMSDIGANLGYIITSSYFQSGAFDASLNTNVRLKTWTEFLEEYEETWLQRYFFPTLTERLDPLFTYTEPLRLEPVWFELLTASEKNKYNKLYEKYFDFGNYMFTFSKWARMIESDNSKIKLPLTDQLAKKNIKENTVNIPREILEEYAYREFLKKVLHYGERAISEFRAIRDIGMRRDNDHR